MQALPAGIAAGGRGAAQPVEPAVDPAYERGMADGMDQAGRQYSQALAVCESCAKELKRARTEFIRGAEQQLVELALAIARKVVEREIESGKDVALCACAKALEQLAGQQVTVIRLNPADLDAVKGGAAGFPGLSGMEVEFSGDEFIARGGCIVESVSGSVDADIPTRFGVIEEALKGKADGAG